MTDDPKSEEPHEAEETYVYIVQTVNTGVVLDCFSTKEKAEQFVTGDQRKLWILKCRVA
mgnify:FL=1